MSERTLVFVDRPAEADPPEQGRDLVVLDTAWTPGPGERSDLIPVRPTVAAVLERVNLFDESLERLDAWAAAARLADRFSVDGVSWWFHARGFVRFSLHELLLWRHVLDLLAPPGRYDRILIPAERRALLAAAQAGRLRQDARIVAVGDQSLLPVLAQRADRAIVRPARRLGGAALRRIGLRRHVSHREGVLRDRIERLAVRRGGVLAVVRGPSFHVVDASDGLLRGDPLVTPVLERLERQGVPVVAVALGLSLRRGEDWNLIELDDRLLPWSVVARGWSPAEDDDQPGEPNAGMHLTGIEKVRLDAGGFDLGPGLLSLGPELSRWFRRQRRQSSYAERLMRDLEPAVLFTGWESARTAWLAAARRLGIPSVAVQHGVIYPNNPDYRRPSHQALLRPTLTCVFGPYERDLLVEVGGYDPAAVIVTGSPRVDPERAASPASPEERAAVRNMLGVAGEDRMLVISASRFAVGEQFHSVTMAAQVLAGPLPGIHLVFKLHPEETGGDHYKALVIGLAEAGGYPPPPISIVRDIDIYRLLRAADAHLGQYSTVLTDAVLTGTPNMIAVGQAWADPIGYVDARVAIPVRSVDDVRAFMTAPQPPSPGDRARFLDAHFRRGDAAARIADVIRTAMAPGAVSGAPTAPDRPVTSRRKTPKIGAPSALS